MLGLPGCHLPGYTGHSLLCEPQSSHLKNAKFVELLKVLELLLRQSPLHPHILVSGPVRDFP